MGKFITCENFEHISPKSYKTTLTLRELAGGYPNFSYRNNLEDEGGSVSSLINILKVNGLDDGKWLIGVRKLLIHPDFQRAYIVGGKDKFQWRQDLIESVVHGTPINPIFIGITENGLVIVVIDGQQRLITLLDFICGITFYNFAYGGEEHENYAFHNLPDWLKDRILDYKIDVNIEVGTEEVIHEYFRKINQPTFVLNAMELRCATHVNKFVEDAKKKFVKVTDNGKTTRYTDKDSKYYVLSYSSNADLKDEDKGLVRMEAMRATSLWASRVELMETSGEAVVNAYKNSKKWPNNIIDLFVENHKNDEDATVLTDTTTTVIDFIYKLFLDNDAVPKDVLKNGTLKATNIPIFKKFDSKVGWDMFWFKYKSENFSKEDCEWLTKEFWRILGQINNRGWHDQCYLFEYLVIKRLYGEEEATKYLSEKEALNPFTTPTKDEAYKRVGGIDITDGKHYEQEEMHFHHAKPRFCGGNSEVENCIPMSKANHQMYHANGGVINGVQYNTKILLQKLDEQVKKVEEEQLTYGHE